MLYTTILYSSCEWRKALWARRVDWTTEMTKGRDAGMSVRS
jgi:hypothetical protein